MRGRIPKRALARTVRPFRCPRRPAANALGMFMGKDIGGFRTGIITVNFIQIIINNKHNIEIKNSFWEVDVSCAAMN